MTSTEMTSTPVAEPGWYRDPREIHQLRYFDGTIWTPHVTHAGPSPCDRCFEHSPATSDQSPSHRKGRGAG